MFDIVLPPSLGTPSLGTPGLGTLRSGDPSLGNLSLLTPSLGNPPVLVSPGLDTSSLGWYCSDCRGLGIPGLGTSSLGTSNLSCIPILNYSTTSLVFNLLRLMAKTQQSKDKNTQRYSKTRPLRCSGRVKNR